MKKPKVDVSTGGNPIPKSMRWAPAPLPPRVIKVKDRHTGREKDVYEGNPGHPSAAAKQRRQDKQAARKRGLPLKKFLASR